MDADEFSFAGVIVDGISFWTGTGVGPLVGAGDVGDFDGGDVGGLVAIIFAPDCARHVRWESLRSSQLT